MDADLRDAINCSCLLSENPIPHINALTALLTGFQVHSIEDAQRQKLDVKEFSLRRTMDFPLVCLRLLFSLARLSVELRRRNEPDEVVRFALRKFVDLSEGRRMDPLQRLDEILAAAAVAGINGDVTLRRRNLHHAIDSGLGRSVFLQQHQPRSVVSFNSQVLNNLLVHKSEEATGGSPSSSPESSAGSPASASHSDEESSGSEHPEARAPAVPLGRGVNASVSTRELEGTLAAASSPSSDTAAGEDAVTAL